ncbi:MAG: VWA domain-containing protein [Polyangiaceae bacterium]|nr:VWA domain-containing protein [Polyangiaceae bacterium]
MTSRGSAVGAMALATFIVACGSGDDDDNNGATPKLKTDAGSSTLGGDGSVAAEGGTEPISEADLETLRNGSCSDWSATSTALPSSLMLVVDVSSSMNERVGGRTKWEITREALIAALNSLPATTEVGLLLYPNEQVQRNGGGSQDVSACVNVDAMIAPAALGDGAQGQRQLLIDELQAADLQQGTPTHDAVWAALDAFAQSGLTGNGFVLLITDGQPTVARGCVSGGSLGSGVDPEPIVAEVDDAANRGIRTFVIGSPGSENEREWLSSAARSGGTAYAGCSDTGPDYCHFDMTTQPDFSTALNEALAQIAGSVVSCSYPIPEPPAGETIDPNEVNIVYTSGEGSVLILRNDQADCSVGWQYATDGTGIVLCSETCSAVSQESSATVELFFGCESKTTIL